MDGELVKECIDVAADIICDHQSTKNKKKIFNSLSLSRPTLTRRTEQLIENMQKRLDDRIKDFIAFYIALDESTDLVDTAQLAVFVRGVNANLQIAENLLALCPLKGTTTGQYIFDATNGAMEKRNLNLEKLDAIVTDGAPSMTRHINGFVVLLQQKLRSDGITPSPLNFHGIIHQEHLAS